MAKRILRDTKLFKKEVGEILGKEYVVIGEFVKMSNKIEMHHTVCDKNYLMTPESIIRKGFKCPHCSNRYKKTTAEFAQELEVNFPNRFNVIGEYVNNKTSVLVIDKNCGNEIKIVPNNVMNKGVTEPCVFCRQNFHDTDSYKKFIFSKVGEEFTILGEYSYYERVKISHNSCNKTFDLQCSDFAYNIRCPFCNTNRKNKNTDSFKEDVFKLIGDEYTVMGEYIGTNTKILMTHNKCGKDFETTPNAFVNSNNRCPHCVNYNFSYGEQRIIKLLEENQIEFERQFKDERCFRIKPLSFDFLIRTDTIKILIEYDGKQHFIPFNDKLDKKFIEQQERDVIKTNFCLKNSNEFALERITYKEDIKTRIDQIIKKYAIKKK